eukprot:TRINITY_DN3116_c0_g2_i3.p1 TRINITY_DN3116_c0_g2~~TRINITY_DN3116_c0_g2_i3.p1  ORF type:complete len:225 (+),score=36.87 TRINITY_DN3116_c0_g2_i3:30-704(+)
MGCNLSRDEADSYRLLTEYELRTLGPRTGGWTVAEIEAAFFPVLLFHVNGFLLTPPQLRKAVSQLRLDANAEAKGFYEDFFEAFRLAETEGIVYDARGIMSLMILKATDDKERIGQSLHALFDVQNKRHFYKEDLRQLFTTLINYILTYSRHLLKKLLDLEISVKKLAESEEKREKCVEVLTSCYMQNKWSCIAAQFGKVFAQGLGESDPTFSKLDFTRFETYF